MANNDKNFKVKNGLDVKGSATVDNDLLVSGTLTAQVNTPTQDSDVANKAYVDAIDTHDSAAVVGQINATVNQSYIDQFDTHDSAAVVGQINLEVDQAFIDQFDTHDSAAVQGQIDATLAVTDTHDSAAVEGQISARFAQDVTLSKDLTVDSDLTVNGVIKGPSTFIIDPALHGDSSGTLVILGNLQVDGVSTVIQSNTVSITDKNIVLADSATNGTEANGAGITVNGANASITYVVGNDNWEFNKAPYYLNDRLLTTADDTHDSAAVVGQINDVVNQSYIDGFDTHDSAAVVGQINAEVDKVFVDALGVDADTLDGQHGTYYLDYNNFTNTPNILDSADVKLIADSAVDARTDQDLFTTSDVEFAKVTSNLVGSVHFTALNDEGTALAKGEVVYLKGISGNTPTVAKADADDATKMPAFGVVETGANNGANVTITTLSVLDHFDTQTPGWSEGDTLYVSTVAGQLTNTKPTGESSLIQNMGHVTKVDTTNGQIKVVGAGRTAATPNLDLNRIFIGNASNQAITMSLDSAVDSDHVQSKIKQSFIDTFDTHDSAAVVGQIADTLNDTVTITKHSTTDPVLKLQSTVSTADAAPIMEFVRNTNQANNGDYLGQIKFLGEDSSGTADGSGIVYAKITGKISDPTDGTEDGLIEYMVKSNGSNLIMARMTGNNGGKLIMENGAGIEVVSGDITIAGNSVLTTASDTHDSAAVVGQINLEVDKAFVDALNINADQVDGQHGAYYLDYNNFTNTPTIPALGTDYVDSAEVNILIAAADTHDSAAVVGQINLEVDKAFVDALAIDYNALSNKPTIPALGTDYVDSAEVNILIAAADTHDSAAVQGQIDANFAAGFTVGGDITFSDSDDLSLPDNSRIKLGTNGDLQIYHDGVNNRIRAIGTGPLFIENQVDDADIAIRSDNGSGGIADYIRADGSSGEVKLYHYGSQKFNTTATGVNITGEVIVDTLTPSTDSALASKAYVDANAGSGGTSSSSTIALNLLDSTGRAGTILTSSLRTGDPVYFDYDANVWTGAYTDSDHVASHVIVEYSTINSNFKIAQTGVFNLESDGNPVNTLSPHFWYHLPTTSGAFPSTSADSAVGQVLYYALDSDTIDLNIGEPRLTSTDAGSQSGSSSTTSSSYSVPISMLTAGLGVGDPIYYDSDAVKWVGASDSADGVASHVIVKYSTLNSTFDIAQSGIHILDSDGASPSFDTNSYYFLSDSTGVPTKIQPINGIYQSLYYALDSDTLDINIGEAQDISPSNPNEARITTISVTSSPYVIPFASGGKMFVLNAGSSSCTFNSANFLTGDRLSVYNNTNSTRTLTFDTYSDGVRIAGSATNYSGSSLTLAAYGLAEVTAITDNGLIVTGGVS